MYEKELQEHLAKYFLLLSSELKIWVWNDMRVIVVNCHSKKYMAKNTCIFGVNCDLNISSYLLHCT